MHWDTPWGIADDLFALQHVDRSMQETQLGSWVEYLSHELSIRTQLVQQASRKQWRMHVQNAADMNKRLA
jgi:hypothetical protein